MAGYVLSILGLIVIIIIAAWAELGEEGTVLSEEEQREIEIYNGTPPPILKGGGIRYYNAYGNEIPEVKPTEGVWLPLEKCGCISPEVALARGLLAILCLVAWAVLFGKACV